jgi:hypothetical protein
MPLLRLRLSGEWRRVRCPPERDIVFDLIGQTRGFLDPGLSARGACRRSASIDFGKKIKASEAEIIRTTPAQSSSSAAGTPPR